MDIYELLKSKDTGFCRKIQLDTLRKICDATGYSLEKLLADIEYIPKPKTEFDPNTVVIIGKNGEKTYYTLSEKDAVLIEQLAKSLHKVADLKESK